MSAASSSQLFREKRVGFGGNDLPLLLGPMLNIVAVELQEEVAAAAVVFIITLPAEEQL